MRRLSLTLCLLSSLLAGCSGGLFPIDTNPPDSGHGDVIPQPSPANGPQKPAETFGLDTTIPQTMQSRDDALALAAVAREFAVAIRYDGTQKEPRITTTAGVGKTFAAMNQYAWQGKNTLATDAFKKLTGDTVKRVLEPDGPSELTGDKRATAEELFLAIEYGLWQVK